MKPYTISTPRKFITFFIIIINLWFPSLFPSDKVLIRGLKNRHIFYFSTKKDVVTWLLIWTGLGGFRVDIIGLSI